MSSLRGKPDFALSYRCLLILLLLFAPAITSCHRKNPAFNEPIDQLYQSALQKMQKKKYFAARSMFQALQARIPQEDRELLPLVQIKLADCYYLNGGILNLGEALSAYRNFLTYYPQREEAAYAQFQVGMSLFGQVLAPDRDQELTLKAITEFEKVERLYPDSPYVGKAQDQILKCREKLAAHNFLVGSFYYKRKDFLGAADRYRVILENYPQYSRTEETLLLLGNSLVATLNPDEARLYYVRLVKEYPKGKYLREAQARLKEIDKG
jgi:outer membrane protein assembly factor BamD